ncbi:CG13168 [Drosophila busckii]|uniref:Dynein regulatory complex protein 10 n=1 Tax=Drosophila busckii TaxID=30019 RepID=A0A0M4EF02_DROBS|nr:CG13168 [Drosophila busckii]
MDFLDFVDIRIPQIERVLETLDVAVERIKMSVVLPKLIQRLDDIRDVLMGTQYEEAIYLMERLKVLDVAKGQPLNQEILGILDWFQTNHTIYKKFPRIYNNLPAEDRKLIKAFEVLYEVAAKHLERTSASEISMERKLHEIFHQNKDLQTRIERYKQQLNSLHARLHWKSAAKRVVLDKCEDDLANRKWQNSVIIQNEIDKRSKLIRANHLESITKQTEMEEELEKAKAEYQVLAHKNLMTEKEARAEKAKLLIQLQSINQKYDTNISEKLRENLYLEDEYLAAKKELDTFMILYRKEELIYKRIVSQYEEEERRKQQTRIVVFMMNRAARQIQKYWRRWKIDMRKKAKRLAKKGKKK